MAGAYHRLLVTAGIALVLGACGFQTPPPEVTSHISPGYSPNDLIYCAGHSCRQRQRVSFSEAQWKEVRAIFETPASHGEEERQQIRAAIGLMERITAPQAGTETDLAGTTPIFFQTDGAAQLDCYDEAANTSNFLGLLARDGLVRLHAVKPPVQRLFVGGDYIHATAVIEESDSGVVFAVDSTFHHNGEPAETPPLDDWLAGWAPANDDRVSIPSWSQ